jgi:hypothetical protein
MTRPKRKQRRRRIQGWKGVKPLLEHWRKNLANVWVELKQPRAIALAPIDFVSGEQVGRKGTPTQKFRGQLIYFTNDDVAIRRPSGAILVVDNYEIVAISDGRTRFEPN